MRGGTGGGVGVGSGVVGSGGGAARGSAWTADPCPCRCRRDKASALDGLESFHGVGWDEQMVSVRRASGSGCPSGS